MPHGSADAAVGQGGAAAGTLDEVAISIAVPGPAPFSAAVVVSPDHERARLHDDLRDALQPLERTDGPIQVWLQHARDGDDEILRDLDLHPYRELLQLRCPLPVEPSPVATRNFDPASDVTAFLEVNRRAFAWHPEQGQLDEAGLAARMNEPWFDADGFRILEIDDRIAGYCWTKIHAATDTDPALGEIFAIAIDPDHHGRGLGMPMTLAGLEWLTEAGLTVGMLYVESDNMPALATYRRIGFTMHASDRAYRNR